MAIVVDVQNLGINGLAGDQASIAVTTTSAVASGGFIVVAVAAYNITSPPTANITSVVGGGLTWTVDKQGRAGAQNWNAIISAQAPSGLASSTAVTVTFASTTAYPAIGATSFTGVKTSSPVDGTPVGPTSATAAAWATASYTIQNGSLLVGGCFCEDQDVNTPTAGTEAWESDISGAALVCMYRIEATGGSFSVGGSWGASGTHNNVGVAYLAAPSAVDTGLAWIRA